MALEFAIRHHRPYGKALPLGTGCSKITTAWPRKQAGRDTALIPVIFARGGDGIESAPKCSKYIGLRGGVSDYA